MNDVEARSSVPRGAERQRMSGTGWWLPALAGAMAFWVANLFVSWTPMAAAYRSAMSIEYLPMLVEAAVGGLVVSSAVSVALLRLRGRLPGIGVMRQALALSAIALLLLTVVVEVPSKLRSGVADPGHWLIVASMFNVVRILALGVAVGLVIRPGQARPPSPLRHTTRER